MSKSYDVYLDTGFIVELSPGDFNKDGGLNERGRAEVIAALRQRIDSGDWGDFLFEPSDVEA